MYSMVYNYDKVSKLCGVVFMVNKPSFNIMKNVVVPVSELANTTLLHQATPLNYAIADNTGEIIETLSFNRFSGNSVVILYELVNKKGDVLRYGLLSQSGQTAVVTKEQLYKRLETNPQWVQNAIFRNGVVNRAKVDTGWLRIEYIEPKVVRKPVSNTKPAEPVARKDVESPVMHQQPQQFTPEQIKELKAAEAKGVDIKCIYNSKLSPKQMRVLWVASSKGCLVEAFASPSYSVDVMKFYADKLYTQGVVRACKPMLKHPELELDVLTELYYCIIVGVPYEDLIGKTATEISIARMERVDSGAVIKKDEDLIEKATYSMMKIKGML